MSGSFSGITNASAALRAFQVGLDTTGNNIANVNTAGYARQTVDFAESQPETQYGLRGPMEIGTGVSVATVNRIRDQFLAARQNGAQSDVSKYDTLQQNLKQVESTLNDTSGSGISDTLDKFYNAWSSLSSNPNDSSAKSQVQYAGSNLAQGIRSAYSALQQIGKQYDSQIKDSFKQIDNLTSRIATLNSEINKQTAAGGQPNSLLDQRDKAISDLSKFVNLDVVNTSSGAPTIYSNGILLVDASGARSFPTNYSSTTGTISDGTGAHTIQSGSLAGLMQSASSVTGYEGQLDNLANTLRTQVNTLHKTGVNSSGQTGLNFFNDSTPQTGATDFDLDSTVKSNAQAISSGTSGNAGDGALAKSLGASRNTTVSGLGSQTISQYYTNMVGQVGQDSAKYASSLSSQNAILTQIGNQVASTSGVSLDDEMTNMMRFQRSYQASAKVLSVMDQTTSDLINTLQR